MKNIISKIQSQLNKCEENYLIIRPTVYVIIFSPFIIVFLFSLFYAIPETRPAAKWMILENHPVELLTFISLFSAGILGWILFRKTKKYGESIFVYGFYAMFSAGLFFVAMEEISWGQWFFGFRTPETIGAVNAAGEFNFHNMPALWTTFESLRVTFGIGGLIGVWFSTLQFTRKIGASAILSPWFVFVAIIAALDLYNYYTPPDNLFNLGAAKLVEVLELLIGLSAFLYMWLNQRMLSSEWGNRVK